MLYANLFTDQEFIRIQIGQGYVSVVFIVMVGRK